MRSSLCRTARQVSRDGQILGAPRCRLAGRRWESSQGVHQWSTPLAKQLAEAITTTGPIPVASYMRQCLTSDLGGYYTAAAAPGKDQFGVKGDFVTSPEISQVFGELVGIWIVAEWIAQGRRAEGVYLMEMGPGRGTLMDDILRTIRNFPELSKAIEAVYMVEASASLREAQHKLLCGDRPLKDNGIGHESTSRHSNDLKIIWAEDLRLVPREADKTPFIVAHEFFDALPIHVFQSAAPPPPTEATTMQTPTGPIKTTKSPSSSSSPPQNEWREMLVSPKAPEQQQTGEPEFELVLSRVPTAHALYLPEISPRYRALRSCPDTTIEVSPESQSFARDMAIRLGGSNPVGASNGPAQPASNRRGASTREPPLVKAAPSGAALIIDYGTPAAVPTDSLRGIRAHERVSPFAAPGAVDVSVDVDFLALAEAAIAGSPGVEVHGPVDQARFLTAMGIEERAAQLVKRAVAGARGGAGAERGELTELVKRVESGYRRLIDRGPQGMGRLYQVMALVPYNPPKEGQPPRRPVGFGGDITL